MKSAQITVSGKVQGVFFRASTQAQARKLGFSGWVRNLLDGRVEVLISGPAEQAEKLRAWLHRGPPRAHVTAVVCTPVEEHIACSDFDLR